MIVVTGCASPPPQGPTINRTFDKPFDQVWQAAVDEVSSRFPVKVVQKDSGILDTGEFIFHRSEASESYSRHPKIFGSAWGDSKVMLSVFVKPEAHQTFVRIRPTIERFEWLAYNVWFPCQTTGKLESEILDGIAKR